ncbi:MAG: DNA polymerase [bacterium]|nr:DNA polymerase [bacterium]
MQLALFPETHTPDSDALERCLKAEVLAVDVETETRWPGHGPRLDYGLSYPAAVTVIGLAWQDAGTLQSTALAAPFDASACDFLVKLFQKVSCLIAHNAVFDLRQLSRLTNGLIPTHIWDTQTMARLLSPRVDARYSLIGVAQMLGLPIPERQQSLKGQRGKLHLLPLDLVVQYAQDDAKLAYEIYLRQRQLPHDADLVDWECRAVYEYALMSVRGMRLNASFVERRLEELRQQRAVVAERLRKDGLKSPRNAKARAQYLYQTKGLPLPEWPGQRRFFTWAGRKRLGATPDSPVTFADLSTNSYVIETYLEAENAHAPALRDLAAFQEVDWLISTLEGLLEHAVVDGRLHSLITIAIETGRRASSNPHMQNWKMPEMAGVAVGDDGFTLVEIDFRNAENIMAALISSDNSLAAACATPDFHSAMAAEYFGEAWDEADAETRKRLRTWSKKITYGTNYGMGADALGRSLGVSQDEARRWIRAKDRAFPAVTRARAAAQRQVEQTHLLHLWTGRPVAVPTPFVAWNYLCQGGVSEVVKRAIVVTAETYRERGMRSRVALDMHDALILEVAHDEWDEAINLASQIMSSVTPASLTERTTPPIRWTAQPNLRENQQKWGAEQWHPGG